MASLPCVLTVGDDSETVERLAAAAAKRSLSLTAAASEASALALLETAAIDVVTFTASREWTSALRFAESLDERWPGLPLILFVAALDRLDASTLASGVFDIVTFEATEDEIGHALDKALAHSRKARALPPRRGRRPSASSVNPA